MGRHSWRPAHVHYKISAPGMHTHISQAYFEGGAYVEDDCCEDVCEEHVVAERVEDGVRIVEVDFVIPKATEKARSEEHTSELQSLMLISYAVFCLKKKKQKEVNHQTIRQKKTHTNN